VGSEMCIRDSISREGNEVWSFWRPSQEELAAIITGGAIALRVAGQTHPPLSLHVMTPEGYRRKCETAEEIKAVYEANRVRCNALLRITKQAVAVLSKETGDKHMAIIDQFLDLLSLNSGKCEVVRDVPDYQPEPPKA
jgi:hypothetical protein